MQLINQCFGSLTKIINALQQVHSHILPSCLTLTLHGATPTPPAKYNMHVQGQSMSMVCYQKPINNTHLKYHKSNQPVTHATVMTMFQCHIKQGAMSTACVA